MPILLAWRTARRNTKVGSHLRMMMILAQAFKIRLRMIGMLLGKDAMYAAPSGP
jgi:hypothetical protein